MKTNILLLPLLLLFIVTTSKAQTNSPPVGGPSETSAIFEINPVGQDFFYHELKFGRWYKFKITHVNTIKLNGYTTSKPFSFDFAAPSVFTNVTIPSPPATTGAKPSTDIVSDTTLAAPSPEMDKSAPKAQLAAHDKELKDFRNSYTTFIATYQKLKRSVVAEDTLYNMMPGIIIRDITGLKNNAKAYMTSLYDVQDNQLETALIQALTAFNANYLALKAAYEALNGTTVSDPSELTGSLKNKTGSVSINVAKATATIKSDPKFLDEYTAATKLFSELNTGDNPSKLFNKAFKGIVLYRTIQAESFTAYTDPEQLSNDEAQVTPILKNGKGTVVKEFNPINIKATGGVKVDFTTGYLLTFKADDNYTEGIVGGAKGVIRQETNKLTNAIGALAHVYWRTAYGVTPALSGGFSLTNNGNIGFYLGGSGLFLEKNRLALTAGISCIKVNVLNTGNLTDSKFNSDNTIINYDSLYKTGFFVGITYNIFTNSSNKSSSK